MDFMTGIKAVTSEHQASLSVYTVTEASYIVDVSEGRLQGLITLVSQIHDRVIPMLAAKRIPLVVVGETHVPGVYSVDSDNVAIGAMVASHLLELGHRRIGFIGGPRPFTMTEARLKGYKNALQAAGIQPEERFERFGKHASETGNHFAHELVEQGVTALMCDDDTIALGALNALHTLGKRVPEDVAVVGSNNSGFTLHTWPPLTTVDTHVTGIGRCAAEVLMQVLDGQTPAQRTIIEANMVIRGSSRQQGGE
jgi:LacI family transcriptional regulator